MHSFAGCSRRPPQALSRSGNERRSWDDTFVTYPRMYRSVRNDALPYGIAKFFDVNPTRRKIHHETRGIARSRFELKPVGGECYVQGAECRPPVTVNEGASARDSFADCTCGFDRVRRLRTGERLNATRHRTLRKPAIPPDSEGNCTNLLCTKSCFRHMVNTVKRAWIARPALVQSKAQEICASRLARMNPSQCRVIDYVEQDKNMHFQAPNISFSIRQILEAVLGSTLPSLCTRR